jgi:L-seryl-tRNA(Ser) seleniumtransferase
VSAPRIIPSIEQLRQRPRLAALDRLYGSDATTEALRSAASDLRMRIVTSAPDDELPQDADAAATIIETAAERRLAEAFRGSLRPAINATGVVIHTNLGRAPLTPGALDRVRAVAKGYSNLEYDLSEGGRGSRTVHAEGLLTSLTGAEAGVVVNNNAAATLLILASLASGREVVVSRGELVEIGGGFRVPDVMAQSDAVLREVGTTNRTRVADYRAAIGERTALLMRVHPSNFRIEGFTERPSLADLVAVGRETGVPVAEDLGSGCMNDALGWEPTVQASIRAGIDVVCFSGDKLLGGPQCGIVVGRRDLIDRLRRHPLMRALRVDKLTLAALEGTLIEYAAGRAAETVPVLRMILADAETIEARAQAIADRLLVAGWQVALISGASAIGGGSAPGIERPTVLLALEHPTLSANHLEARLRALDPPIVARIERDHVVLDLRTVLEDQDPVVADLLAGLV